MLESYDSSTAVSALTGRSDVRFNVLGHGQALPYNQVTASGGLIPNAENFGAVLKTLSPVLGKLRGDLVARV